ncbi:hypothetical protein BCR44DRAFT_1285302 [Catenaria anguillulae PL171]|uniref:Uncharacterized protein n=1 Tax=Catenaria anguillulae PL171 TaxID=765915 RepID=A0A1Y2HWV4_9FUNG|nr:hypothetical protein BCR44DRAFT_1285302 [Catenaria anguillulae PL171]
MRQEQEAAMGFQVPVGQPGSRFSIISPNGSTLAAPPTLMFVSRPQNSDSIPTIGSGPRPMLHRMASAPVMIRPISFVGSATPTNGTPNTIHGAISPASGVSADSSPYLQSSSGAHPVPVYMIPVSSAAQMDPSFAYATMNHAPNWAAGGIQYAPTLPLNAGKPQDHTNQHDCGEAGLGINSSTSEPITEESDKAQAALIPEADNVQRRPSAENVRHRQIGGSPQSATFAEGYLPHSSSTFSLTED